MTETDSREILAGEIARTRVMARDLRERAEDLEADAIREGTPYPPEVRAFRERCAELEREAAYWQREIDDSR
jgi:hypothetical protein